MGTKKIINSDIIVFKKTPAQRGRMIRSSGDYLRLDVITRRFTFYPNLLSRFNIKRYDRIVFAFSQTKKAAFIKKDNNNLDGFEMTYLYSREGYFTSKHLCEQFVEYFKLKNENSILFIIKDCRKDGWSEIKLTEL